MFSQSVFSPHKYSCGLGTWRTYGKYTRANGDTVYKAEIVVKKDGVVSHRESKTFDKQMLIRDWWMRREVELQEAIADHMMQL